ncbi:MAG: zinc ribbon domain-containing protein [Desulfurococcales archaeon]|nr:zinc ribbon domain-containing protein [Desulfurococcales archaeon]
MKKDLSLADHILTCPKCGLTMDRDYNASLNILRSTGLEPPLVPVELRPLPVATGNGHSWAVMHEAQPLRAG